MDAISFFTGFVVGAFGMLLLILLMILFDEPARENLKENLPFKKKKTKRGEDLNSSGALISNANMS